MTRATELAFLRLKSTAEATSPATISSGLEKVVAIITQKKGFIKGRWGTVVEDPTLLCIAIDWEDAQDHKNVMASPEYKDVVAILTEFIDLGANPVIVYSNLTSYEPDPFRAPITELVFLNMKSDLSESEKSAVEDVAINVMKVCKEDGPAQSTVIGSVVERMPNSKDPNGEAIALNLVLGWDSVEQHMAVAKTERFQEVRKGLVEKCIPAEHVRYLSHVAFRSIA